MIHVQCEVIALSAGVTSQIERTPMRKRCFECSFRARPKAHQPGDASGTPGTLLNHPGPYSRLIAERRSGFKTVARLSESWNFPRVNDSESRATVVLKCLLEKKADAAGNGIRTHDSILQLFKADTVTRGLQTAIGHG
jgi:hypothetical protein